MALPFRDPDAQRVRNDVDIPHREKSSANAKVDLDYPVSGLFWRMTCDAQEILDAPAQGS